jgi:hypothetical protein
MATSAQGQTATPDWQLEASTLYYGEKDRTRIVEPVVRATRLFSDRQSVSIGFGFDSMTGASPTGARPSGAIQTTTTPSGNINTVPAGNTPLSPFRDQRYALDLAWQQPLGRVLQSTAGFHFSHEKDYRSLGSSGTLSAELLERTLTLTIGGGYNRDRVTPEGGTHVGLTEDSLLAGSPDNPKRVTSAMAGVSRVLSRRWLVGLNASRSWESGYLTDPYKMVSLFGSADTTTGQLSEKRPSDRDRKDVMGSSVYHFTEDVVYASYRYYWDDWGLRSHTADLKYRHELGHGHYLQPHFRYYTQTQADFFTWGLEANAPLPAFASSDERLAPFHTMTYGLKYGLPLPGSASELGLRVEYMRRPGHGDRSSAEEASGEDDDPPTPSSTPLPRDVLPRLNVVTVLIGYSVAF